MGLMSQQLRMLKKTVQQGRSERRDEAYASVRWALSDARTPLADFFSILLEIVIVINSWDHGVTL